MKDMIFSPSFGNRPKVFVGRRETISEVLQGLNEMPGSRERAVLLMGQRGYGKTVLLLEIADAARKAGYVVASPTVVSPELLNRILEKLTEEGAAFLPKKKKQMTGGSIGILGVSAGVQFQGNESSQPSFARQLSSLCQELNRKEKGVLILVDELAANQQELRQLIIAYQEMVGEEKNIALIMAGLPSVIASTLQDHVLTFLNRAKKISLGPLKINEIDLYYKNAFAKLGIEIPSDLRYRAAEKTEGSPYLMQLIGHYITLEADPGCTLTEDEVEEAIGKAEEDFKNDICQTSLNTLSEKDILFLKAMAQEPEEYAEIGNIQNRLGVSSAYVQTYKRRLIESGVIEAAGRGRVRFAVPFLQAYLAEMQAE